MKTTARHTLAGLSMAALTLCAAHAQTAPEAASPAVPEAVASAPAPRWVRIDASEALRVRVHLMPLHFKQGRDTSIFTGYRPELRWVDHPKGSMCALTLPPGVGGELKPGETTEATARCLEALKLREDRLTFQMFQGGRLVGEGQVLL